MFFFLRRLFGSISLSRFKSQSLITLSCLQHGAIFDAHSCFVRLGDPVLLSTVQGAVCGSASQYYGSVSAAVGSAHGAAATVLQNLYPANSTDVAYVLQQALNATNGADVQNASQVGVLFGQQWYSDRQGDGFLTATSIAGQPGTAGMWAPAQVGFVLCLANPISFGILTLFFFCFLFVSSVQSDLDNCWTCVGEYARYDFSHPVSCLLSS